jgi:hypothetical protein
MAKEGSQQTGKSLEVKSMPYLYRAFIKRAYDKSSMGRLQVYIPELAHPRHKDTWISVRYLSPFAGASNPYLSNEDDTEKFNATQTAFGFWMVPSAIETEGLVGFINGKINDGVWLGSFFQENVNFTVPGIPSAMTYQGPSPGAEKNKWDDKPKLRPEHKPMAEALKRQGLLGDKYDAIRGTTTSGAQRESPSRVYGILTPGQHQFIMDDGTMMDVPEEDKQIPPGIDQGIRLRTSGGAQILLNDEKGLIYIINSSGTAWVELTNEGKMDVFCTDDISYHSLKDFNLHVDGDINIQAKGSIKIRAEGTAGININATTGDFQMKAKNYIIQADKDGNLITGGKTVVKAARLDLNGGEAKEAVPPKLLSQAGNVSVLDSVCTRVPEHEPWVGHEDKKVLPLGEGLDASSAWT